MAKACTTCQDSRRSEIDAALIAGESIRHVSARYAVPTSNLFRHRAHIAAAVQAARTDQQRAFAFDIEQNFQVANAATVSVLANANRSGDGRLQLQASNALVRQCEVAHGFVQDATLAELTRRLEQLEEAQQAQHTERRNGWQSVVA